MAGIGFNTQLAGSLNTQTNVLSRVQKGLSSAISRLGSGERIQQASDDVASLSISTQLSNRITSLKVARTNLAQASSLLQVADGGMQQIDGILQRMSALAVMSNSGGLTVQERSFLDREFQQLKTEIDRISNETQFNGVHLLNRIQYPRNVNEVLTGTEVEESPFSFITFTPFAVGSGNNPPVTIGAIPNQSTNTNVPFSYSVPVGAVFNDPEGDPLTYSATLASGAPLPPWLTFNPGTQTFSGTPTAVNAGTISVTVRASDGGGIATQTFDITVIDPPAPPVLVTPLVDRTFGENTPFSFTLPPQPISFSDPNLHTLTFSATLAGGAPLPGWLTFNSSTRTFSGNAPSAAIGTYNIEVTVTDPTALTATDTFQLTITNINEAPFNLVDTNAAANQIAENSANGTVVGITALASDPDVADTLTYSLDNNAGGRFQIDATTGIVTVANGTLLNFENATSHNIVVRATDAGGLFTAATMTINVTNVNEAPFVNAGLTNRTASTLVPFTYTFPGLPGAFNDPDSTDTLTYSIVGAMPGWLNFNPVTRTFSGTPGAGDAGVSTITVRATDAGGLFIDDSFDLTVIFVNNPPTNLALSNNMIAENSAIGTVIGTLSTTDADLPSDSHTYTILADPDAKFTIVGNQLQLAAGVNFEADTSHNVTIRTTDSTGAFFDRTFAINVTNVNEAPFNLIDTNATANQVAENSANGTVVGITALASDPDVADTRTYSLDNNAGGRFQIDATTGVVTVANGTLLNFEAATSHNIVVRATDAGGLFTTATMTINVTNVNEAPFVSGGIPNQLADTLVPFNYTFPAMPTAFNDVDSGDSLTYSIVGALPGWLSFNPATRSFSGTPGAGDTGTNTITVRATDTGGLFVDETFDLTVSFLNNTPTNITLSNNTIPENSAIGTVIGTLSSTDADLPFDSHTYSIVSDPDAKFTIVGNQLRLAAGVNFETDTFHNVTIRTTDASGAFFNRTFAINITNVNEAPFVTGGIANQSTNAGVAYSYTFPAMPGTYNDVDSGDSLTYSVVGALPGWLSFNPVTRTFSGTPAVGDAGTTTITVRATDLGGLFVDETFDLTVIPNTPPFVVTPIPDQTAPMGVNFSYTFPAQPTTFNDAETTVTYSVVGALPGWLSFNAATRTFTGRPQLGDNGTTAITVRATDAGGLFVDDTFNITVPAVVSGWEGEIWDTAAGLGNLAAALAIIAGGAPTATFISSAPDYPQGATDNQTGNLGPFLGADVATLVGLPTTTAVETIVFRFRGLINVPATGNYTFRMQSDDGFRLMIDGAVPPGPNTSAGNRGFGGANTNPIALTAGMHTIELIYYENSGQEGMEFFSNFTGALAQLGAPYIYYTPGTTYFFDSPQALPADVESINQVEMIDPIREEEKLFLHIVDEQKHLPQEGREIRYSFRGSNYDDNMKVMARQAMQEISSAANIRYIEDDTIAYDQLDLTFTRASDGYAMHHAGWTKELDFTQQPATRITLSDHFLDYQQMIDATGSFEGSYTYLTMLHEMLHVAGLDHPEAALPGFMDSSDFTLMSYEQAQQAMEGTRYGKFSAQLGDLDKQALTYLYGAPVAATSVAPVALANSEGSPVSSTASSALNTAFFAPPTTPAAPVSGDNIIINGIAFSFVVGADPNDLTQVEYGTGNLREMLTRLTTQLNAMTDPRISQARYELVSDNTIKITHKSGKNIADLFKVADNLSGLRNFITVHNGHEVNAYATDGNYTLDDSYKTNSTIGSGSVIPSGKSFNNIMLSPEYERGSVTLAMTGLPADGEILSIDDGLGGSLDFVMRTTANTADPFEIQIGADVEETLDNMISKLASWVELFGDTNNSYVMRQLDFGWKDSRLIISNKVSGDVLNYQEQPAVFFSNLSGATLSSTNTQYGTSAGINTDYVANDQFYGQISGFTSRYLGEERITLSVKVGNATYEATIENTDVTQDTRIRFNSEGYGFFDIELAANQGMEVNSEEEAGYFADRINQAFSGIYFTQKREVTSFEPVKSLEDAIMSITQLDYDAPLFFNEIKVYPRGSIANVDSVRLMIMVNGEDYYADMGNDDTVSPYQTITLYSGKDRREFITFTQGSQSADLSTAAGVLAFEQALKQSLPVGGYQDLGEISFQAGERSSQELGITIRATTTKALFDDALYLNIRSVSAAKAAFEDVNEAIDRLTERRAEVGAFAQQVNYASAAIESSIINQDSVRAVLADTDIAMTSTEYSSLFAGLQAVLQTKQSAQTLYKDTVLDLLAEENQVQTNNIFN